MTKNNLPVIRIPNIPIARPEDDKVWENKFYVKSESSDRLYVVSQNIKKRHWGCSCPAYRTRRQCKHLRAIGLPENERPFAANLSQ